MPDGQQTWAKDAGGPPCLRKEAKLPQLGAGFMKTGRNSPEKTRAMSQLPSME